MLKLTPVALATMLICTHGAVAARSEPPLPHILVQEDKTGDEEPLPDNEPVQKWKDDIPASMSVITRQEILERGARSIKDVLADEPDVVVRTRPSEFTATRSSVGRARNEAINIRGIEGNRVLIVQDGIRLPNGFSFGPAFQTGRGDYWDVDSFGKIEILRGPNSIQYGADSIAGVVSASALQVGDLVKAGRTVGGFVHSGYAQQENSFNHSAGIGFDQGRWQGMFMHSRRSGHETWSQENGRQPDMRRTAPNPMNVDSRYTLARLGLRIDPAHRVLATFDQFNNQLDTDVLNAVSPWANFRAPKALLAHDTIRRQRRSLEHFYDGASEGWLTRAHTHLYRQQASVRQFTSEEVFGPTNMFEGLMFKFFGAFQGTGPDGAGLARRTRDNKYLENTTGLAVAAQGLVRTGMVEHRLGYGVEASRLQASAVVDGTVPAFLKPFPYRPTPDSSYTLGSLFLQDEMVIGGLRISAGVRHDRYRIAPDAGSLSAADQADFQANGGKLSSLAASAWTPRLGVLWEVTPAFVPYFSYAQGFRAPEPSQVNANFKNATLRYQLIGNPGLRPERVAGKELGVRGKLGGFAYALAGFDSRYTDFIGLQGRGYVDGINQMQNVNYAKAHVRGLEARAEWQVAPAWRLNAAWAVTRGDLLVPEAVGAAQNGSVTMGNGTWRPLNSVQPMRIIGGARYRQQRWGAYVNVEHSWGKTRGRVNAPSTGNQRLTTDPFTVVGLGAHVNPMAGMTLSMNIENLFNATYERWSDIGEVETAVGPDQRRHSAPPRSLQVSMRYAF
ncbi:TonB-dependent hemoglobin/transferrin/lactoferrin family receptor [Herbaspirillum sp. YR522]|uniref:TonB-dependent hemoglobin/transferrin/lactoferrin family receptor n=1 Tax=Herbaspirillum sp. YR522 TaxID=1144342 RepID=UPI00026F6D8A|nr:TonB-dependent hemoglobin/transferrin/lactoferrin family receptor [Herbaspirillum sp. YR522]EJN09373.1 TonB-dependent hemoglobin/transferrin/lactoferrin receptor family protein [Herbaspirillum sp. YR522]